MESRLFLLEFHVGTINFEPSFGTVPLKKEIAINIKFGDVSINIEPEELPIVKTADEERKIVYDMGKSYLFTTPCKELYNTLKDQKLEIALRVNQKSEGDVMMPWSNDFCEMINLYEKIGVVKAVDFTDVMELKNKSGEVIGKMDIFLRLSCLGHSVETQYRCDVIGGLKEYVFKNPYDRHTFKCEIIDGEVLPVMNLLNPVTRIDNGPHEATTYAPSWTEIFGMGEAPSRASYSPFVGTDMQPGGMIPLTEILQRKSVETISIIFRPDENKYFDFLNVFNTEVSTTRDTTKLTFTKEKERMDRSPRRSRLEPTPKEKPDDPLELTADKINKKLCKNKDCPAAIKFKEYGIGPLATGKGLGTLYGEVDSTTEYGISNTYGTMSNYGPFGVYSRPKRPDQPFIPPKNALETKLPPEPKCCSCCNRLRGGGPWPEQPLKVIENSSKPKKVKLPKSKIKWTDLLKLKGGGALEVENTPGDGLKSPIKECKGVMDKFDEILVAYRKALGPCGQATCPNAPSLAQEKCKSTCGKGQSVPPSKDDGELCETPCDFSGGYTAAACRDTKCVYAKYKLNLVDNDAAIELQYLPPAISGKCGRPKCPYPIKPDLPPIHWDCPDPLPKGNCKNMNCPFQPPDLKKLRCPEPKPGPCGSPECPYALPPPCGLPTCPFQPRPKCPFLEKEENKRKKDPCYRPEEEEDDYICENPECPFANDKMNPSESFDDTNVKGKFIDCSNPQCPFATKKPPRPKARSDKMNICGYPSCPFANVRKMTVCTNSTCPYAPKPKAQNMLCNYPQCPFAEKPALTSKQMNDDYCYDPNCPFKNEEDPPKDKSDTSICENPDCPYNEEKCSKMSADCNEKDSVCDNPECPFTETEKRPSADQKTTSAKDTMVVVETQVSLKQEGKKTSRKISGEKSGEVEKGKEGKKKKKRSKFVYSMGNQYPGVKVGHKECVTPMFNVPPKMGWLWNVPTQMMNLKPRRGWKPGAIQKDIAAKIRAHREAKGLGTLRVPKFKRNKDGDYLDDSGDEVNVTPKPTLQIQKKDGAYWITMNPLKDPKTLVDNENPYMECTPMQFKITKNKKKKDGTEDDDSRLCYCEEEEASSSSSDSELDIEFTPPAGIIHPERFKKKKNIVHCEAQYDPKDFETEKPEGKERKGKGKGGKGDKGDKGDKKKGKGAKGEKEDKKSAKGEKGDKKKGKK